MKRTHAMRRSVAVLIMLVVIFVSVLSNPDSYHTEVPPSPTEQTVGGAAVVLGELDVKGRAPKTGYTRAQFGDG